MTTFEAAVIGVSAGGVDALSAVLPKLPPNYPLAVMVVIHIPPHKESLMTKIFQNKCQMTVKEAEDKELITPGRIYFAPPDYHLLVEKDGSLSLSSEEPVFHSRPSIDVLFETATEAYKNRLIGVILTGASEDGAHGLQVVMENGGTGLVQSPDTAYADAMPIAALTACPGAHILSLEQIGNYLKGIAA